MTVLLAAHPVSPILPFACSAVECGEEFASGKARFCGKCGGRRMGI